MKYDFTSIMDRHGKDAIAVDGLGTGFAPDLPKDGFDIIPMWVADMNFPTVEELSSCGNSQLKHTACACKTDHKSTDKADGRILDKVAQSQHDERDQRINDQDIDFLQSFFDKYRGTQDCCKGSYCIEGLDLGRIT